MEDTLSKAERAAVNRMAQRVIDDWDNNGREWEPVDLIRALNTGAAKVARTLREPPPKPKGAA